VITGLKHQKEKRSMEHFAGLDVSVKDTSVCIVDGTGKIVREAKVASEPDALLAILKNPAYHFKRIGLEAGPLSQWLFSALGEANLPVICVELIESVEGPLNSKRGVETHLNPFPTDLPDSAV
jgi:transposase